METRHTILWNVVIALALVLGAGAAHAQDVMVVDGNVIAITDLDVRGTLYDVDFVFETGSTVYGDGFDFAGANEVDVIVARGAVNDALNAESPVPDGAGPEGEVSFFIGFDADEDDFILAVGGEKIGLSWETCSDNVDCIDPLGIVGATVFLPEEVVTWALFTESGTGTPTPEISIMPTSQVLSAAVLLGEDAPDDEFFVSNSGSGTLNYTITVDQSWLSVSPTSETSDGEMDTITVSYSTADLDLGVYNATITVRDSNASNDSQVIDVTLFVTELPGIALSESMLMPQAVLGNDPLPDSFTVVNSGGMALFYEVSVDVSWMTVNPVEGKSTGEPDTIEVVYDTTGLLEGVHDGTITVDDFLGGAVNSPQTIDVLLTIAAASSDPLGMTSARQTTKVNTIPGINFDPVGSYTKVGFPLDLAWSGISGSTLFHDGGAFTFSVGSTSYTYSDWTFEVRSTCEAGFDPCPVTTDQGTPWALRNVDPGARTARMVFTDEGADDFNDLVVPPSIVQVFVTSQAFKGNLQSSAGNLTGLSGADSICTQAAKDATPPLTGAWTAWLSDDNTDVVDRMFDAEFQLLNGTVVADNLADLTDGTLDAAINLDENRTTLEGAFEVWTSTDTDGTNPGVGTCVNWTSNSNVNTAQIGRADAMDATWTDVNFEDDCDVFNRLYCFSASKFVAEEPFADVTFIPIPEPSAGALGTAALTALGLIRLTSRRRRR